DLQFSLSLIESDSRPEARNDIQVMRPCVSAGLVDSRRYPGINLIAGESESWRRDPNHGAAAAAEDHRLSNQAWVSAEVALPQAMAQDYHAVPPTLIFFRRVRAAQFHVHAQRGEKAGGSRSRQNSLGFLNACKSVWKNNIRRNMVEALRLILVFVELGF